MRGIHLVVRNITTGTKNLHCSQNEAANRTVGVAKIHLSRVRLWEWLHGGIFKFGSFNYIHEISCGLHLLECNFNINYEFNLTQVRKVDWYRYCFFSLVFIAVRREAGVPFIWNHTATLKIDFSFVKIRFLAESCVVPDESVPEKGKFLATLHPVQPWVSGYRYT